MRPSSSDSLELWREYQAKHHGRAIEDRLLHAELAGYQEYAQDVRFRLMPGIW
jgi:hypothetical protein